MLIVSWRAEESLVFLAAPAASEGLNWSEQRKPPQRTVCCGASGDPFQSLWKFIYLLPRHSLSDSSPSFPPPSNDTTHAVILGLRDRSCATRLIPIFISKKLLDTFFLVISGLGIYTTTQITWPFCSPWLKQTRGRIIMRTWVLRPTRNRRTLRSNSGS